MTTGAIEEIEHTADRAIRVCGRDLEELFVNAALGMTMLMADISAIEPNIERHVELEAFDTETLLVSWLGELLCLTEASGAIFAGYEIRQLTPTRLEAAVWGDMAPRQWKHIKAVTFHDLKIVATETGYEVTLVLDV